MFLLPGTGTAQTIDLATLQADDEAVLTVGYRLQTRAGDLCAPTVPIIGLSVHDLDQYAAAYRTAAARLFERPDLPAVLAVARDGAAEQAGVRLGDTIAAIGGVPISDEDDGLQRVEAVQRRLDAAAAAGPVDLTLIRRGRSFTVRIAGAQGCPTRFQTLVAPELNARADGARVEITTGLLRFVRGPDELAAVLAHELAHDILHHRERLDALGRRARLVRRTETEADQLSVYLLNRAGYSTAALLSFWNRIRREQRSGPFGSRTHPADRQRLRAIGAEIERLARLKTQGSPLRPAFLGVP